MSYPTAKVQLRIVQGATFDEAYRFGITPWIYKAITGITKTAPVVLTVPDHDLTDGWSFAVSDVRGMSQINARNNPPEKTDFMPATVVNSNTIAVNAINAASYGSYTGGGHIQYSTPIDLTGKTARLQVRASIDSETVLLEMTTENDRIVLDADENTVTLYLTAVETAELTWTDGEYQLELVTSADVTDRLMEGRIKVSREGTR